MGRRGGIFIDEEFHFNAKVIDGYKHSDHPSYTSWLGMRQRCYYEKHNRYERYGGRGIKVCDRWKDDFSAFVEDMGIRPEGCSIERIDNDKDYEPGNCKWATSEEQANNRGTRSDNRAGEKYIRYCEKRDRYMVFIRKPKKFGRYFKTLKEAVRARDNFLKENF